MVNEIGEERSGEYSSLFYVNIRNTPGTKDYWKYKWPAEFIPYRTVSPKRSD
ncbi:hypothetical protein GGQ57_000049 [Parabacteroides faecis]|uniref:Uncharacterized protein n=1 Tax=Parabacteroides faecis TaxID=1217282 RepID=A0ABR6KFA2_9BACT|nr:hypothetical protein [Parabacteroides faecis]